MNPTTGTPGWQIPTEFLSPGDIVAPVHPAFYLARVAGTSDEGVFVELWEVPGGLTGTTTLTGDQLGGLTPEEGDTLRIYTWMEIPKAAPDGFGAPVARVRVELTPEEHEP